MNDIIWIAGFFDGEGSIHLTTNGCIQVRIYNKNIDALKFIQSKFPAGRIYKYNSCYNIRFNGKKALTFLEAILPYLKVRKKEAELAVEYLKNDSRNIDIYRQMINKHKGDNL